MGYIMYFNQENNVIGEFSMIDVFVKSPPASFRSWFDTPSASDLGSALRAVS
jgi:hypothetical protein